MNGLTFLIDNKTKKHPVPILGCFPGAALLGDSTTRSVSCLLTKKVRTHESIRRAEARLYETDVLHGRIMIANSLGYGNHPLFLSPKPKGISEETR